MELIIGNDYKVVVTKIIQSGIIVELEDKSTQLIHISNLSDKFVSDINLMFAVGDVANATAIAGKVKPVELSIKAYSAKHTEPTINYQRTKPTYKQVYNKPADKQADKQADLDDMINKMNSDYESKFGRRFDKKPPQRHLRGDRRRGR